MTRPDSRIRSFLVMAVAAAVVGLGAAAGWEAVRAQGHSHSPTAAPDPGGWYKRLSPDARAAAIERQLRGFETTMAEVAYRYTEMYFGGIDGNWDYAAHMAHELGGAISVGLERRPQYRKNADALFLKGPYPQVVDAIRAKDLALFKQRIEGLRAACTACHAAEAHPFIKIGVPTVRRNPVVNE
ncbi:MAG TPA: hypothetical protein VKA83_05520 [Methylomirabilota bacterium]|nr:hypothetical protein [Methylomirabilota bacterium]